MKIGNQQCNTPSGHVRKHVSALEAATVGKHVDSPTSPAEALRRTSHCKSPPLRQSTGSLQAGHLAGQHIAEATHDEDIAGWEAALKHAAGSHKTLVHTVEHYKQLLQESEAKLQQERASHEEDIRQMAAVTSQLKEMTAALSSREASMGSLKRAEARLSCQVTEQREYIQELQAKLMAALREDLNRLPMQWQLTQDILRVFRQTIQLLQQIERRLDVASPWKARVSGLLSEHSDEQAADSVHLARALCNLQVLQALLADQDRIWDRRLVQVAAGVCYLCIGLIAFCLTMVAQFVDSCIAIVLPSRAESRLMGLQQAKPEEEGPAVTPIKKVQR
ncbi:g7467 [Coccomyxa viridis]|uniref:G7467 protein n=1 Tax=Coccomyxa viridis TaxID=1274662 RepID=A0ABP1FXW9_9CHLO